MKGHLHLTVSADDAGRTFLSGQSFRAPLHLSKPHTDEGTLVVNVVNPTAGLFDGDDVKMQVAVEAGARVVLTTPGAGRVFRARRGEPAVVRQEIRVASGGFAEYFPELFIPHAGARYHQQTTLRVEPGGQLLFCEWLAPGRVARGEHFAYEELLWDTDVWHGAALAARERYRLAPGDESLTALRTVFPVSHYLGFFVMGWPEWPAAALDALSDPERVYLGHGPLVAGGGVVKALCADNLAARRTFYKLREIFYSAINHPMPALRRY